MRPVAQLLCFEEGTTNNFFKSLPFRLLLGIAVGVICGLVFPESVMKVIVTLQYVMGQLITFCVPLIIIGYANKHGIEEKDIQSPEL